MSNYRLLRSQKNQIFDALKSMKVNHFDFDVEDTTNKFKLTHKDTGHFLEITYDVPAWHYRIDFSPADGKWNDQAFKDSWPEVLSIASSWSQFLADEISEPDYWNSINMESVTLTTVSSGGNNVFSDQEKIGIKAKLNQIESFLMQNYNLGDQDKKLISDKLDRLEQLAETAGRSDWLHTAVGVVFTIIVGVGLAPTQAKELAQFAAKLFSQIFGGSLPLLP